MAELLRMKNRIGAFRREFARELQFDEELQAELAAMQEEFYREAAKWRRLPV